MEINDVIQMLISHTASKKRLGRKSASILEREITASGLNNFFSEINIKLNFF